MAATIPARIVSASRRCPRRRMSSRAQLHRPTAAPWRKTQHNIWNARVGNPAWTSLLLADGAPQKCFHTTSRSQAVADPYASLGVGKNATAAEIKKAYYGMAKKYHPDTNKDPGAKDKFAAAQSAYEILSDAEKKKAYDSYGAAAFDSTGGFNPNAGDRKNVV